MNYSDEQLMAYVDGQCDADQCAAIETAAANDPQLAQRLDQQRSQQRASLTSLSTAFDPALPPPGTAKWAATWIAMAASLLVGILLGMFALQPGQQPVTQSTRQDLSWFGMQQHALVTQGVLSASLNEQLTSTQSADAPVRMAVSFRNHAGQYCRAFVLTGQQLAGLACRVETQWQVRVLTATDNATPGSDAMRQAGSALPTAVLNMIDTQMNGEPLDATTEQRAQQAGWR